MNRHTYETNKWNEEELGIVLRREWREETLLSSIGRSSVIAAGCQEALQQAVVEALHCSRLSGGIAAEVCLSFSHSAAALINELPDCPCPPSPRKTLSSFTDPARQYSWL